MATQTVGECKINIVMDRVEIGVCDSIGKSEKKLSLVKCTLKKFVGKVWKLGKEDPRRVIHAIKVGLALTVVSLFYLMEPLFDGVGENAIWAIMTVVVVSEFTAGATLSKGLNRGIGTVVAGCLAVSVGYIAEKAGTVGEAILIGASCFSLGAAATFFRFFPKIKTKYDYGVLIFILTFNMITVSGYRVDNIFRMAYERLSTISIGCAVSLLISFCIFPIWAGEDLHNSIINRFEGLADSIKGCMVEYLKGSEFCEKTRGDNDQILEDIICKGYSDVLNSKASEESLANFASWEPKHGTFGFNHPWKQYVKVGGMLRHLAYCVVALHGCLHSQHQAPQMNRSALKKSCTYEVGMEVTNILLELAASIKDMRECPPSQSLMDRLHFAVQHLNDSIQLHPTKCHVIHTASNPHEKALHHLDSTNPSVQSLETKECQVQNAEKAVEVTLKHIHDNTHVFNNGEGERHSSSESFSVTFKEDSPDGSPATKGEENHVVLSTESLNHGLKATNGVEFGDAIPVATVASLVIEIVARLEHVIDAVHHLGKLAGFKP